jgi:hypothetical protein
MFVYTCSEDLLNRIKWGNECDYWAKNNQNKL